MAAYVFINYSFHCYNFYIFFPYDVKPVLVLWKLWLSRLSETNFTVLSLAVSVSVLYQYADCSSMLYATICFEDL